MLDDGVNISQYQVTFEHPNEGWYRYEGDTVEVDSTALVNFLFFSLFGEDFHDIMTDIAYYYNKEDVVMWHGFYKSKFRKYVYNDVIRSLDIRVGISGFFNGRFNSYKVPCLNS